MGRPPKSELMSCLRLIRSSYVGILAVLEATDHPLEPSTRDALTAIAEPMQRMLIRSGLEPHRRGRRPRSAPKPPPAAKP